MAGPRLGLDPSTMLDRVGLNDRERADRSSDDSTACSRPAAPEIRPAPGFAARCAGNGDRHLGDSEPVPNAIKLVGLTGFAERV